MATSTKPAPELTLRTHICKHWSRHARWDLQDGSTLILFQCDIPEPTDEEYGRGDIPRSEECLLGYDETIWRRAPAVGCIQILSTGEVIGARLRGVISSFFLDTIYGGGEYRWPAPPCWDEWYVKVQRAVEEQS